jgi:hypothetical protein
MSQVTKSVCELEPAEVCNRCAPRPDRVDSRTLVKRYFLDPVLPVLTLLSMSVLTIVILVVIVSTVADMNAQLPGSYVNVDPWAGWDTAPAGGSYQDQVVSYADLAAATDSTEDRDLRSTPPQANDPF